MTTLSPETVAKSAQSLATIIPLLQGFTHRNKNQHRLSHWFASLGLLRTALKRIQAELAPLQRHASRKLSAKYELNVLRAVRWTQEAVIPRCYL